MQHILSFDIIMCCKTMQIAPSILPPSEILTPSLVQPSRNVQSESNPLSAQQNRLRLRQRSNLLQHPRTLSLHPRRLARDMLQLLWPQLTHKDRGEELEGRVWAVDEEVVGGLLDDVVDETFARDLVVGAEDVVDVLHDVVCGAHVVGARGVFQSDEWAVWVNIDSSKICKAGLLPLLATVAQYRG